MRRTKAATAPKKVPKDKLLHGIISFMLVLVLSSIIPLEAAAIVAVFVGLTKEVWDHLGNGTASAWDFVADLAGIMSAFVLVRGLT